MSKRMNAGRARKAYQFIETRRRDYPVQILARVVVLKVNTGMREQEVVQLM